MTYRLVFHPEAGKELEAIYDEIAGRASPMVATRFIAGIRDYCERLKTFPKRGTERTDIAPGLRIVGYHKRLAIAFAVEAGTVTIVGIFMKGRNVEALPVLERLPPFD